MLAEVLEAALDMVVAMAGQPHLDLSEPDNGELALLAMQGGSFDWLANEPDLYTDDDLVERFEWAKV